MTQIPGKQTIIKQGNNKKERNKIMKKAFAILMSLVLMLSLAVPAMAADVIVDDKLSGHTFTVYQIFSGREENGVLSDIDWSTGIDHAAFLAALKSDATLGADFTACVTASDVAKVLEGYAADAAKANLVAEIAYAKKASGVVLSTTENNLADGYYLVVDTTTSVGNGDAYNAALLQLVGEVNITLKTDAPQMEKKVKEDDKYNQDGDYGLGYNDVADYDMNEPVSFHLIAKIPDMTYYDTYKYIFHDDMSDGLDLNAGSFNVYLSADQKVDTADTLIAQNGNYTIVYGSTDDDDFTLSFADLKTVDGVEKGKYIIVEYTAALTASAVVGLDGNPNTAYLEYSNKPDHSGSGDNNNTGRTPDDTVIVFTYKLDVTKVDGDYEEGEEPDKLAGAEFVLMNEAKTKVAVVDGNGNVTGWENVPGDGKTWPAGSVLTSGSDGLFKVVGLDDGTYYLKETKAPTGYNILTADIELVITATTANGQTWENKDAKAALTALTIKVGNDTEDGTLDTGIVGTTVENNKGTTLPETGGMGTTIFYIVGGVMVAAAVVLLITKKRMSAEG